MKFQMHFIEWTILIQISLKLVPDDPVDNWSALVQVMGGCRLGAKPSAERVLTKKRYVPSL